MLPSVMRPADTESGTDGLEAVLELDGASKASKLSAVHSPFQDRRDSQVPT